MKNKNQSLTMKGFSMEYPISKTNLPKQAVQTISIAEELFGNQVLGMYLYGSAALDSLHPNSDIDILIIVNGEMTDNARTVLTKRLMAISRAVGCIEKQPLEVTVINQNDIIPGQFPPKCEYMYGEWLREEMEAGKIPQSFYDADVTILLWQARAHSVPLKGQQAKELIPFISDGEVRNAIRNSLPRLTAGIKNDERNVLLTLSRMWFTLETGKICSKNIAAEWVLPKLPNRLVPLMEMAVKAYLGECIDEWSNVEKETLLLVDFMKSKLDNMRNYSG